MREKDFSESTGTSAAEALEMRRIGQAGHKRLEGCAAQNLARAACPNANS
jgi:hypothetical protein